MRTYLAGPMRGHFLMNFPAFDAAAADLRASGIDVISPADLDRAAGFDPTNLPKDWDWSRLPEGMLREVAERDLAAVLICDSIHLLPGWQESKGARAERAVAEWLGLGIFEYANADA
jgi:hypothetical protein